MATQLPKKANNLEIIKRSLKLEIERRAPVSNSFGSALFSFFFFFYKFFFFFLDTGIRGRKKKEKTAARHSVKSQRNFKLGAL